MKLRTGREGQATCFVLAVWLLLGMATGGCQEDAVAAKSKPGETLTNPVAIPVDSRAIYFSTALDAAFFAVTLPPNATARAYAVWAHPRPVADTNDQDLTVFSDPNFINPLCTGPRLRVESCFNSSTGGTVYAWVREQTPGQPGMSFFISALTDAATGIAASGTPTNSATPLSLPAGNSFTATSAAGVTALAPHFFAAPIAGPGLHQFKVTGSAGKATLTLYSDLFVSLLTLPPGACAASPAAMSACLADLPAAGTVYAAVTTPSAVGVSYSLSVIGP